MTMQYDVKSAYTGTFPAQLVTGRVRLKQMVIVGNGTAGTITVYDGTDNTGPVLWQQKTSSGVQPFQVLVPGEGILAQTGIYVAVTNITSVTICYG
jgi:hypothetical protein